MRLLLVMVALAAAVVPALGEEPEIETTEFCRLIQDWQEFIGETVRVRAVYAAEFEFSALRHPDCHGGKPLVWVDFAKGVEGRLNRLRRIEGFYGEAEVVMEGRFSGPEPVEIDPELPAHVRQRLVELKKTYGHLGAYDMMIEVTRVVGAARAPK